jgi:hypothetical protein
MHDHVIGALLYPAPPVLPLSIRLSQDIFLSNYLWQQSDIWSWASYKYAI